MQIDPILRVIMAQVRRGYVSPLFRVTLTLNTRVISGEVITEHKYREILPKMMFGQNVPGLPVIHGVDQASKRDGLKSAVDEMAMAQGEPEFIHVLTDNGGLERIRLDQIVSVGTSLAPDPKDAS